MSKTAKKQNNKNSMETFFKVLRFIGKYRFLLVLSIILAAVTVVLQLYVPVLFGYAIDEVVASHEVNFSRMWFYLSTILCFHAGAAAAYFATERWEVKASLCALPFILWAYYLVVCEDRFHRSRDAAGV